MLEIVARPRTVNALFYQFDEASIVSIDSISRRIIVGLITSLLVFIPTTVLSFLFRRVQRRSAVFRESTPAEASSNIKLEVRWPSLRCICLLHMGSFWMCVRAACCSDRLARWN